MAFGSILRSGTARLKPLLHCSPRFVKLLSTLSEESIARYCKGGYHPVRIDNLFNRDKYRIVSKLGYGVYSTVWLAFDLE